MIKVPSYLDFFAKLVIYLGIDFDEEKYAKNELRKADKMNNESQKSKNSDEENKKNDKSTEDCRITNKLRIKELREFNRQEELYNKYIPKIIDLLSECDEENKQIITYFFNIIESLMRYLSNKNYNTIASNKRAMWGLFIFYYIPQFACMLSSYKNQYNIPKYLIDNDFMLPIFKSNRIVTPTYRLKNYLKENVKKIKVKDKHLFNYFTDNYLAESRSNKTPSHKTKFVIINELKENSRDKDSPIIHEIESVFNCAIVTGNIYKELRKYFKNDTKLDDNYAKILIKYFKECFNTCNKWYGDIDGEIISEFEVFISFHWDLLDTEKSYLDEPFLSLQKQKERREELFHVYNSYLHETTNSEIDLMENIDTEYLCKGILRYDPDHIIQYFDTAHNEMISFLEKLECIFTNPENELNEESITDTFKLIKDNKYFKNYEHEFLYYEGLNYLAKNEVSEAKNNLTIVREKCTKITAGKTNVRASELLIVLRLLTENDISYFHLNPEIKTIINSQPEELTLMVFHNPDKAIRHKEVNIENKLLIIENILRIIEEPRKKEYITSAIPITDGKKNDKELWLDNTLELIEKLILTVFSSCDEMVYKEIYLEKSLRLIKRFRNIWYRNYKDVECLKSNPFLIIDETVTEFFKLYDDKKHSSEIQEKKDEKKRHDDLYLKKVLKIINDFNYNGYCHYKGVECKKYNPFQKMDGWITDFFQLYDDKQYSSETEEIKLEQVIKTLMKGRNAKYSLKKSIVTFLQYTPLEALHNCVDICKIYRDPNDLPQNTKRFLNSSLNFLILVAKAIENLDG